MLWPWGSWASNGPCGPKPLGPGFCGGKKFPSRGCWAPPYMFLCTKVSYQFAFISTCGVRSAIKAFKKHFCAQNHGMSLRLTVLEILKHNLGISKVIDSQNVALDCRGNSIDICWTYQPWKFLKNGTTQSSSVESNNRKKIVVTSIASHIAVIAHQTRKEKNTRENN